jgi:hypothetical protein
MTDEAIEAKFMANAKPVLGIACCQDIVEKVWTLEDCVDVNDLISLCSLSNLNVSSSKRSP